MTYQDTDASVLRAICDGPGCNRNDLFETRDEFDVPDGWGRMGIGGGYRIFHSAECADAWLRMLSIEERDGSGWTIRHTLIPATTR